MEISSNIPTSKEETSIESSQKSSKHTNKKISNKKSSIFQEKDVYFLIFYPRENKKKR